MTSLSHDEEFPELKFFEIAPTSKRIEQPKWMKVAMFFFGQYPSPIVQWESENDVLGRANGKAAELKLDPACRVVSVERMPAEKPQTASYRVWYRKRTQAAGTASAA